MISLDNSYRFTSEGFFKRSLIASAIVGLLAALFTTVYAGPSTGGRYLLFFSWMMLNLTIWGAGLRELLIRKRPAFMILYASLKMLWLAFLLFLVFWVGIRGMRNFLAFFLGFNTPFLVMFLKALGAGLTKSGRPAEVDHANAPAAQSNPRKIASDAPDH
jgi:hypothetical protein